MRLGNRDKYEHGELPEPGELIWWLYVGRQSATRYYDGGWRVFDVGWGRWRGDTPDGSSFPCHRLAFSFWLPFDRA